MKDNRINTRKHIAACLTGYVGYVRAFTGESLYDKAKQAENQFRDLLNVIFGWELINANEKVRNAVGIDLYDPKRKIMVQVSAQRDSRKKINHTFKVLKDATDIHSRYEGYRLLFMLISENVQEQCEGKTFRGVPRFLSFDQKNDIIDVRKLLAEIDGLPIEQLDIIEQISSEMFEAFPFFSKNQNYQEKRKKLESIIAESKHVGTVLADNPRSEYFQKRASELSRARKALEEELSEDVQNILDLAHHISKKQRRKISQRTQAAIDAFNKGDFATAKKILDVAEQEFDTNCQSAKHLLKAIFEGLGELQLKVKGIMAETSMDIESRKSQATALWRKIAETAWLYNYSAHDADKNDELLDAYYDFLQKYGRYEEALELQRQLLKLRTEVYGEEHAKVGISCNDIGYLLYELDKSPEAIGYLERAIRIKEKSLGPDHPSIAISYNNLGLAYDNVGEYAQALEYHQKALSLRLRTIGENHPYTAASYNNMGGVYDSMGEYDKALEYYLKDQSICTRLYGENHIETGWSYKNIGGIYKSKGEYAQALVYYGKALDIWSEWLGPEHPHTIKVREMMEKVKSVHHNLPETR